MTLAQIIRSLAVGQRYTRSAHVLRIASVSNGSVYYVNETTGLGELRDPVDAVAAYIARGYWSRR